MSDDQSPKIKTSLPITWGTGAVHDPKTGTRTGFQHQINTRASMIKEASMADIAAFSDQRATTCGSCVHYHPPEKNKPVVRGFLAQAIHEAGWKLPFMPGRPEELTRCREDADKIVGAHSKSCDHYRESKGTIR